uniref:Ionotropic glutamate receptor C-terminal domain-containing protein n=1 Tax=Musca domestica TaxID=7370 RepID=A0A1I8MSM2_MUSDO
MVILINVTTLLGLLQISSNSYELNVKIVNMLSKVRRERNYRTIIYMSSVDGVPEEGYNIDEVARLMETPMIQLKGNTSFYLWSKFNRELLAVVPMNGDERKDKLLLESLWRNLRKLLKTRLLLIFKAATDEEYMEDIIRFCSNHKAINVMAIKEDVASLDLCYVPNLFPSFVLRSHNMSGSSNFRFYPNHVRNMNKSPLRLSLKKGSNKSYILKEVNGIYSLGGHVGHFFDEFARFHNATITFPTGYHDAFVFDAFLDNDTLDMSQQLALNNYKSDRVHSDCYSLTDWCIMVPTASPIPDYMFYAMIFDLKILTLILVTIFVLTFAIDLTFWFEGRTTNPWNILFNIYTFNGMLGQPYQMEANYSGWRSVLYVLTCFGDVMVNTTYVTYLQSFNASPPTERPINTLEDALANPKKILMYEDEFSKMNNEIINDYDFYDTRYLYPVPEVQWSLYEQQQEFFAKRKFRLSNICLVKMYGQMVPMQADSPFEEAVNEMIGIAHQAGLTNHWEQMAFMEAVQRKRINLTDSSSKVRFEPMELQDTKWFMLLYLILNSVAFLCFMCEIVFYKLRNKSLIIIKI